MPLGKTYSESVFVSPFVEMWKFLMTEGLRRYNRSCVDYAVSLRFSEQTLHIKPSVKYQ